MKYFKIVFVLVLIGIVADQIMQWGGEYLKKDKIGTDVRIAIPHTAEEANGSGETDEKVTMVDKSTEFPETVLEVPGENLTVSPPQLTATERLSELGAKIGDPVFIRIFKYMAELEIWIKVGENYELLQTYTICRQSGYLGPKLKEGDRQGPEGFYFVTKSRLNPNSKFHLSFNLGYPNEYDRAYHRTGSALMVHGDCVSIGCFAMTDEKIEEIYELVEQALENGQKLVRVHIFPFRMNSEKMLQYSDNQWFDFWTNLKEGYDYFEEKQLPPNVEVEQKRYVFE
ncbi:MAG: murein L,D-transpeptidase family protein [Campylobacterota bacterium]|nr:murein L,D-transpeptidase family protein [Campylobacterota bacterium]